MFMFRIFLGFLKFIILWKEHINQVSESVKINMGSGQEWKLSAAGLFYAEEEKRDAKS